MYRSTCTMFMLLAVCFTETGNAQQTISDPVNSIDSADDQTARPSSGISDSTDQRVDLKPECTQQQQCVFKMSGVSYSAIRFIGITANTIPDIPCEPEGGSDSQLCSCCNQSATILQNIMQLYSEAYTKYESELAAHNKGQGNGIAFQKSLEELEACKVKVLGVCSQVYLKNETICEFIKCTPQQCDLIKTTATTTTIKPTSKQTTSTTRPTTTTPSTTSTTDDTGQSQMIFTTLTSTSSNMQSTDPIASKQDSPNVAPVILGVVVLLLVAVGFAVFLIVWWRRRRAKKGGKTHGSPSTVAFVTEADTGESQYSELSNSVGSRQTADKKSSGAQSNRDSEYDHEYSVIPADVVKFTHPNDLDPGYDVLIDVTKRELPPAPAQDREYSLARNPYGEMKKKPPEPSGLKPAVHSLAKMTAIQHLNGKINAEGGRKKKQGQHFVLEKDEDEFDNAEKKDGQYFILEENAGGDKQPETGGQYFVLEKENADKKPETSGQYFVLEKESADKKPETGGQYFVLENDTASGNDNREHDGQYFVLEKEDADENPETGGQYFVLEKDSSDATGQDQTGDSKIYSSLNRDYMEPMDSAEQASEYTALNNFRAGATSPGAQKSAVPQHESVYSLQKPID